MILITGATGTIGRELVQQLHAGGYPVRVFVRDERKVAHLDACIERAVGDLERPDTLAAAMPGVDALFLVTLGTPQQDRDAVQTAHQAGAQRVVKLSTLEASAAKSQVGKWHREREQIIEASGLAWTFLRPGMFMTNTIQWWAETIKQQGAVYFPGGKGKVAPVDSRDVAVVAAAALTQPGHASRVYELTGPELFSIAEMVQTIGGALGKRLKYTDIPPFAAKLFMLKAGMDKALVNALMEMLASLRRNEGAIVTDTVAQVSGCKPRTFEAWCRDHISEFQQPKEQ
jgi:uncharacterized protein YbjT (DUF2867 family)